MTCRVFVSAHGNVFMREIAEHVVEALRLRERPAEVVLDQLPRADADVTNLVVAPHEFFGLFPASETDRLAAAAASTSINTEQPGTTFFDLAMRYAALGGVVLDINRFALEAVRRAGVPAVHLPLGVVPSMDHWHRARSPRDVDLAFMGGRTARREAFIGGAAGLLWEWRTDLRFFSWHRPVTDAKPFFATGGAKFESLARTRILLNVHRGDEPYFEWARVVEAVANGCVVASEESVGIEPFVRGDHVLMATLESLAEEAVALAFDEPRRSAMADAAYDVLTRDLDQSALLVRALDAVEERRAATARRSETNDAPRRRSAMSRRSARNALAVVATAASSGESGESGASGDSKDRQVLRYTAATLKRAYLAELDSSRRVERALALARLGDADHVETAATPAWGAFDAEVSVVVPLFGQGQYLREAVESVVACGGSGSPRTEIVIVDDHSTDDSAERARELLADLSWFPMTLIVRSANGGLPVARNTGFAAARGRYVFALDADNVLYPNTLRVLASHLDAAPSEVAAAYGLLERFDETGALGLTSHLPWDVELLVQGAYIDAMAMFRRDAWAALGGYASDVRVYGWEDYDLWLAAASAGGRADLVGRIVGRYREQPGSMRKISDIDIAANFVTLRERHPRLPWPS